MIVNFMDFISENHDRLYNFLIKLTNDPVDAEDILQNALIKISESISDVKEPEKIRTWAYKIATNAAMDYFRQHGKTQTLEFNEEINLLDDTHHTVEDFLITDEMNKCIREKVDTIPLNYRTALILFYFEKLPIAEIAAICGTTVSSIKVRLLRGKEMMNRVLKNQCSFYYENNKFMCCKKEIE